LTEKIINDNLTIVGINKPKELEKEGKERNDGNFRSFAFTKRGA
jgi:hypothetical protein